MACGRKLDGFRERQAARVNRHIARPPQHGRRSRGYVQFNNGHRFGGRAAAEDRPVARDAQAADLCVRRLDALKLPRVRVEQAQSPVALLVEGADDHVRRREAIRRHAKAPLRLAELGFDWAERFRLPFIVTIKVPPARAVRDEMQAAIGRPFRLKDGLCRAARDQAALAERAIVVDLGEP